MHRDRLRKYLLIVLFVFPSAVAAEWVGFWLNVNWSIYLYDNSRIVKSGSDVYVWQRIQYAEPKKSGIQSIQIYIKIDCEHTTYEYLEASSYLDANWVDLDKVTVGDKKVRLVTAGSAYEALAKNVCK